MYRGEWVTQRDYYTRRGYVEYDGNWVTPAEKDKLEQVVRFEAPGKSGREDIFTKFEDQTEKIPFRGGTIAVPDDATHRTAPDAATRQDTRASWPTRRPG